MVGERVQVFAGQCATLSLPIVSREGAKTVRCSCEVMSVEFSVSAALTPLKVWITGCDEGEDRGIFHNYVRWLHFKSIRSS